MRVKLAHISTLIPISIYIKITSSHPNHTKGSIVYSQGLRVKRICSEKKKTF